ncbi:MAG: PAS domain S-box protein, partial [Deltaproteobacteria bacterium]|nr:PAS domain S-box protein [Deltaproteobacteria bacterium]
MSQKPTYDELQLKVKELENELIKVKQSAAQARLKAEITDAIFDGVLVFDTGGYVVDANKAYLQMYGLNLDDVIGKHFMEIPGIEIQKPEELEKFTPLLRNALEKGASSPVELTLMTQANKEIPVSVTGGSVRDAHGDLSYLVVVIRDITAQKQAEYELKHQREHLESLIKHSALAMVKLDENHHIISCNKEFEILFQVKELEIKGRNLDEIVAGQEYMAEAKSYTNRTLKGEAIQGSGKRYRQDKKLIDVEFVGVPVIVDGAVVGAYGIYRDISETKKAEEALKESEEKFRLISEQALMGIAIIQDGIVKYANAALSNIIEYSVEEVLSWPAEEFGKAIHPEDLHFAMEQARKKQAGKADVVTNYSYRIITKSGKEKWVDQHSKTISYEGRTADLVTFIDITDRIEAVKDKEELEAQLRQAVKMEAVGTLAGGIAHDFNN